MGTQNDQNQSENFPCVEKKFNYFLQALRDRNELEPVAQKAERVLAKFEQAVSHVGGNETPQGRAWWDQALPEHNVIGEQYTGRTPRNIHKEMTHKVGDYQRACEKVDEARERLIEAMVETLRVLGWRPPVPRIGCGQLLQMASTVLAFILLGCVGLYKEGPEWVLFFSAGGALGFGGWFAFVATAAWNEDTVEEPKGSFSAPFAMMTGGMAAAVWLYSLVVGLENAPIAVGWAKMFTVVAAVSGLHAVGVFGWVMKTFTSLMGKPLALLLAIALSFQTVVLAVGRLWYGSGILGYLLAASIVGMSISVANAFGLRGRARDFFTGLMGDSQPAGDANDTDTGNGRWWAGTIFVILLAAGGMWVVFPHLPDLMPQPVQVTGNVNTVGKGSDAITADTLGIEEEPTPTRPVVEVPIPAAPEPTVVTVPPSEEEAGEVELSAPVVEPEPTPEPKVKKTAPAPAPVKKSAPKKTTPPKNAEASKGKKKDDYGLPEGW